MLFDILRPDANEVPPSLRRLRRRTGQVNTHCVSEFFHELVDVALLPTDRGLPLKAFYQRYQLVTRDGGADRLEGFGQVVIVWYSTFAQRICTK
jgi:hypothetical protein